MAANIKSILVVDDEEDVRNLVHAVLTQAGYEVDVAASGQEAIEKIKAKSHPLILTDVRMPGMDGTELLKWVIANNPTTRVVLMTGFSEVADTIDAVKLGARGFVMKPFKSAQLLEALQSAQMQVAWASFDEKEYGSITISDFISPVKLKYPLFIRLSENQFMKIGDVGDSVPRDKLLQLREKGINEIWLRIKDFETYRTEQQAVAAAAAKRDDIPLENRLKMLKAVGEMAFEHIRVMGVNIQRAEEAVDAMKGIFNSLADTTQSPMMLLLEGNNNSLYSHSVACAVLAATYANLMGWTATKNIETLVQSAFLHDIGLVELPLDLQSTRYHRLDRSQKKLYEKHPHRSFEIVNAMGNVPREVADIVLQHHENAKGTGFPLGITKSQHLPLARVLQLIVSFVEEWRWLPQAEKSRVNSATDLLNRMVVSDPMAFERKDVQAVELALSDMELMKARRKLASMNYTT